MDLVDDMLPFTPSWFPPSPEPFPSIMELLQDPMTAEIENFDGIFSSPAISEAIPSTSTQPSVFPCPESSTIPQISPDMQQQEPLDDSHGYLQQSDQQDLLNPNMLNCYQEPDVSTIQQQQLNLPGPLEQSDLQRLLNPNMMYSEPDFSTSQQQQLLCNSAGYLQESDHQGLLNPNMLNSFYEPDVSAMLQQPPPLYDSHGYLQQSDQQDLMNQNMMNSFQGANVSTTQQQQLLCNSHGHVQGNLSNIQSDQQYLSNQNATDLFQEPNNSTMIDIGQQIEEGNNGYAHQPLIDPFELPNHHQEQFPSVPISQNYPSYPVYQHGPVGSHFNMYGQQPPPLVLTNREEEHLPPRNVTDLASTYHLQNQISTIPPQSQMTSSSTRIYPLQNQISMIPPQSQVPSSSTRTYPIANQISMIPHQPQTRSRSTRTYLRQNRTSTNAPQPQIPSSSTRNGNVQELVSQPLPSFRCPQVDTSTQISQCTNSFTTPIQSSNLGRRQRSYQNHFDHGESSSASQRKRMILPKMNVDSTVANPVEPRLVNELYSPRYESLGIAIDPFLRKFHFQR
ncbi:hypothetical protein ISN44_As01g028240 [Arabidopsis suecica]|uniref:Uncharacterized protein n=1 Tax=Arabidopsis suecica TaxID=45249 RepID=A0A8T2H687_ARASU|nr:hypothetical protein ISN44_As01g028240 [Arabidopsis suecica]